jgi:uncharacterized protein YabN with tetrapyrrole methylase and pyrophosphatase domain
MNKKGSLVIVGTGIRTAGQLTPEAIAHIRAADKVLYVLSDRTAENVIRRLNPGGSESLEPLYRDGKPRMETYREMIERIVACVHEGLDTVTAFYGHPGVFAYAPHAALRRLREEGYDAIMLPGISAEDCLFADLGLDPSTYGCQSHEATSLVVRRRTVDPACALILWQVGVFGNHVFRENEYDLSGLHVLVDHLRQFYPADHEVCVYEAAIFPGCQPRMDWVPLGRLTEVKLNTASTLFVPPSEMPALDLDLMQRLGFSLDDASPLGGPSDTRS